VLVPDIGGWRRERMPTLQEAAWFETAPDWVCEILSPSTARDDRVVKMPIYASTGVAHLWLLDPDRRTLDVYDLDSGRWVILESHRDGERVAPPPFGAVEIGLGDLWA
jgi:Uma2 family endonuclease